MKDEQKELLRLIRTMNKELSNKNEEYWHQYSSFNDWQFWIVVSMLIIPLIILGFKLNRERALIIGFYGLNYHIWFAYTNSIGIRLGLWEYPYEVLPILPSFAIDASLAPVSYMLLYQWTLMKDKNFYIYSTLLSAGFAFIFKPIIVSHNLFKMFSWVNYFHLFVFYVLFFVVSKIITNLFINFHVRGKWLDFKS